MDNWEKDNKMQLAVWRSAEILIFKKHLFKVLTY